MRRWFLSYNSQDLALVEPFEAAIRRKAPDLELFFAPKSLRAGGYWLPTLAENITTSSAFVLLVGEKGLGPWQVIEYYEALDKRVKAPDFPVILVLLEGQPAPGLPFLRQLHWIVSPDPASERTIAEVMDATAGGGTRPGELWRHTAPYRGLAAMTEADSDFFFGRAPETVEILKALEAAPDRLPILLGNSGVGKSSLAQAGVLAALKRQAWPERSDGPGTWAKAFQDSRRWCFLKLQPGTEPLRALVEPFLRTWQLDATSTDARKRRSEWVNDLAEGKVGLRDLLDASEERIEVELRQPKPPAFFLYVDQGEELYVRAEERQRRRFSELLAQGIADPRLHGLMSLRSDFLGALQSDRSLFDVHSKIDVPPLREADLQDVVSCPAALLSARFETDGLAADLALRTAEESVKDAGALPLLSYLLDDMWTQMVRRGDGVLRLPVQALELGGVLVERADAFLASRPGAEDRLRRLLTLKLATVHEDAEPTRRRASRSEFSEEEWRLVSELADHPYRLLATAAPEGREPYAEVAHEAIFRRWEKLRAWIAAEREFLVWKARLEADRRRWEETPEPARKDALLMGLPLSQAQGWLAKRAEDLSPADREFIALSSTRETQEREQRRKEKLRRRMLTATIGLVALMAVLLTFSAYQFLVAASQRDAAERQRREAEHQRSEAERLRSLAEALSRRTLVTQSRFLANLALQYTHDGDVGTAMSVAIEALPDPRSGLERPYVADAEGALFAAWQRLQEASTRETTVFEGHEDAVLSAAFSPSGRYTVTASKDRTARLWEAKTGKQVSVFKGHADTVCSVAFGPDDRRIVTASFDGTARIWDAETGTQIMSLEGHNDAVFGAAFSPDGRRVVTASQDRTARIWDAQTGKQVVIFEGHTAPVEGAHFSPDGKYIVTASLDRTARLWEADTGRQIAVIAGHTDGVTSAAFSPDGRRIVTASMDRTARIWDAGTGMLIAALEGHTDAVLSVSFSADGRRIATASKDRTMRVWDAETGKQSAVLAGHMDWLSSVAFSPNGRFILTTSWDKTARLWDAAPHRETAILQGHADRIMSVAFSPDGQRVITASKDGTARVWDAKTGSQIVTLKGHTDGVTSAVFGPDGMRIATASTDKTARIWDATTGALLRIFPHTDAVLTAAFSPDGRRVVTASVASVRIWDVESGRHILLVERYADGFMSAIFSHDGRHILTTSRVGDVATWDPDTRTRIGTLLHTDGVIAAAFSPDSRHIATASSDRTARLWEADTGRQIAVLVGHTDAVLSVSFSPDGRRVSTASLDRTGRIWNAATGMQIIVLRDDVDGVLDAAFSPDNQHIITASENTARIWPVFSTTQDLIDHAKAVVPRCLTREQREKAFLDPEPPAWCIEMGKWPYATQAWKDWLRYKWENTNPPMPDTSEWDTWISAHKG